MTSSDNSNTSSVFSWHKIADISVQAMQEQLPTEVSVGTRQIGLLKRQDKIYAFAAKCPHAGVPLCTGWLDGQGRIVCPKHKYRFDPTNGRNTSGEGYKLFTYPVEIRGDEVWIGLMNLT